LLCFCSDDFPRASFPRSVCGADSNVAIWPQKAPFSMCAPAGQESFFHTRSDRPAGILVVERTGNSGAGGHNDVRGDFGRWDLNRVNK
jgi:hypothetical protein